jgi:predicted aspartyl protease
MVTWNSSSAKVLVTFSLVSLFLIATAEAVMLIRDKHYRPETTSRSQTTSAKERFIPPVLPPETYVVHGSGTQGETHIPFRLKYGTHIEVRAIINGRPIECIVDTGAPGNYWPSWLNLTHQRTGLQATTSDAGNHTATIQEALLDHVQVGGLELQHMPSYAMAVGHSLGGALPVLGNPTFAHTVLTIDYAKHELIIRPSIPNSIPAGVQDRSRGLNFKWLNPDARGRFGVPCVRGNVLSLPANMTIDTGWNSPPLGLTRGYYNRLLPQLETNHIKSDKEVTVFTLGKAKTIRISRVSWSVGGIAENSSALAVDALSTGADAVLGWGFLRNFRTTIDYPQQKIWFDPIQPTRKHQ